MRTSFVIYCSTISGEILVIVVQSTWENLFPFLVVRVSFRCFIPRRSDDTKYCTRGTESLRRNDNEKFQIPVKRHKNIEHYENNTGYVWMNELAVVVWRHAHRQESNCKEVKSLETTKFKFLFRTEFNNRVNVLNPSNCKFLALLRFTRGRPRVGCKSVHNVITLLTSTKFTVLRIEKPNGKLFPCCNGNMLL